MASIKQRSPNSYLITVSAGYRNGKKLAKYKTVTLPEYLTGRQREKELNKLAVLFEREVERGNVLDGEKLTFAEFAAQWLADYAERQLSPSTLKGYKTRLNKRILPALGHIKLAKLQPHHLIEFYGNLSESSIGLNAYNTPTPEMVTLLADAKPAELAVSFKTLQRLRAGEQTTQAVTDKITAHYGRKGLFTVAPASLSGKTIKHHHDLICSILSMAVRWNVLASNPAERVTPPKAAKKPPQYYEEADLTHLLAALQDEPLTYKALVFLAVDSGLRSGELAGLMWEDIDFDGGQLHVNKQRQYVTGYGVISKEPKTASGVRAVTLSLYVLALLKAYRTEQLKNRLQLGEAWTDSGNVFVHDDGQPLHPNRPYKWFMEFLARHDLPKISFHALRHTNASMMIAAGADVVTVSGRLGHSDKRVTLNVYSHMIGSKEKQVANQMNTFYERVL